MERPKTCYILAAWGGWRRMVQHPDLEKDGSLYVREHVKRVLAHRRVIDHLVLASPRGYGFYKGYEEYLKELESTPEVNGVTVEVFRRENIGFSYGSFNDVYGKYRTKFDYYFVAEDDYFPDVPGFDQILLDMVNPHPTCGFLCGLVWKERDYAHGAAAIFLGLMRAEALEKIWVKNDGCLARFSRRTSYEEAERLCQLGISRDIVKVGYSLLDWSESYSSPFWRGKREVYGDPNLPPMYITAQDYVYGSKP